MSKRYSKMITLNFSEEEIQRLKYEKDFNPSMRIRKRLYVIISKMSDRMSNEKTVALSIAIATALVTG